MQTYTKTLTTPRSLQTAADQIASALAVTIPAESLAFLGLVLAAPGPNPSAVANGTQIVITIVLETTADFEAAYPTNAERLALLNPLFVGEYASKLKAPVDYAISGP